MGLKTPRWLLILEILLALGSLTVLAYKAATWVQPLPAVRIVEKRINQKVPARPTIMDYYRMYPDRYIRVEDESWQFNAGTRIATHSFTLRNVATVPYKEIQVRITYEGSDGKVLLTREIRIPGPIPAQGTMSLKKIQVTGVPLTTKVAVVVVAKALMVQ